MSASYGYGALLILGGALGAMKGSMASLYAGAGIGSSIILLERYGASLGGAKLALQAAIAGLTAYVMFQRYMASGKVMPAGLVSVLSVVYALVTAGSLLPASKKTA